MPATGSPTWKRSSASAPGSSRSKWATTRSSAITLRSHAAQPRTAPENYIRKQTLVNAERYITPEMKEYETLVLNAEERIREIESRLFREVCARLAASRPRSARDGPRPGRAGCAGLAGRDRRAGRLRPPEVVDGGVLEIHDGRHPVVEQSLQRRALRPQRCRSSRRARSCASSPGRT